LKGFSLTTVPSFDGALGAKMMQTFNDEGFQLKDCPNMEGYPEHPCYFIGRLFLHLLGLGKWERSRPQFALNPQFQDLWFLYWLVRQRRPKYILEYGIGHSTVVMALACFHNGGGGVQCLDAEKDWVRSVMGDLPPELTDYVGAMHSPVIERRLEGRLVLQHLRVPDMVPDMIYVDSPDLHKGEGPHFDGIVDPLYLEPKLKPGCAMIIDGRPRQCMMLMQELRRPWSFGIRKRWESSFYELKE